MVFRFKRNKENSTASGSCSNCGVELLTDAQFEAMRPETTSGPFETDMTSFLELTAARDAIGVSCRECGADVCVKCIQEHGRPHPASGGLSCLECGGAMTQYLPD